jgi:hypothetical protein
MAERKDRMALLSRYSKLHTAKYENKPSLNLNVEQWAADALVESYGLPLCYELLDYYFYVSQTPAWNFFTYNAGDILKAKTLKEQDDKERSERRQMAKAWLKNE